MVRYTLRQCEYFCAIAREGGIAQAARSLNITQPAIAQALDKLEELTGLKLFDRHHAKGMELTAQGRAFLGEAQRLLELSEQVNLASAQIAQDLQGSIRLGCFQSIAPFHIPRLTRNYQKQHPKIKLDVSERLQEQLISGLLDGDLDLAILYDLGLDKSKLSWQVLAKPKPYILLSSENPLAHLKSISLTTLAQEPYVLFDAPGSREYFFGIFAQHNIVPEIAFRSTSLESVRSAVGHGLGFSLLAMRPQSPLTYEGQEVVALEIEDDIEPTQIVLAKRLTTSSQSLIENFSQFCQKDFV